MKHGGEWHAVLSPRSSNAYDMVPISSYNTNVQAPLDTWDTLYVAVYGGPASAGTVAVEVILNLEYTVAEDQPVAQLARPQPILNIPMQTAINQVQSQHPTSHIGSKQVVTAFVKKEARKALVKHVFPFVAKKALAALA